MAKDYGAILQELMESVSPQELGEMLYASEDMDKDTYLAGAFDLLDVLSQMPDDWVEQRRQRRNVAQTLKERTFA